MRQQCEPCCPRPAPLRPAAMSRLTYTLLAKRAARISPAKRTYMVTIFCVTAGLLYADQNLMAPNLTAIAASACRAARRLLVLPVDAPPVDQQLMRPHAATCRL